MRFDRTKNRKPVTIISHVMQRYAFGNRALIIAFTLFIMATPVISVDIEYEIVNADNGKRRTGRQLNDICHSGDEINLSVLQHDSMECHLMVFFIDSMMYPTAIFPVNAGDPNTWRSGPFNGKKKTIAPRTLNKITGIEIYYAVASSEEFSFKEIAPFVDTTLSRIEIKNTKGSSPGTYELQLPSKGRFSSAYIYFNHRPAIADIVGAPGTPP